MRGLIAAIILGCAVVLCPAQVLVQQPFFAPAPSGGFTPLSIPGLAARWIYTNLNDGIQSSNNLSAWSSTINSVTYNVTPAPTNSLFQTIKSTNGLYWPALNPYMNFSPAVTRPISNTMAPYFIFKLYSYRFDEEVLLGSTNADSVNKAKNWIYMETDGNGGKLRVQNPNYDDYIICGRLPVYQLLCVLGSGKIGAGSSGCTWYTNGIPSVTNNWNGFTNLNYLTKDADGSAPVWDLYEFGWYTNEVSSNNAFSLYTYATNTYGRAAAAQVLVNPVATAVPLSWINPNFSPILGENFTEITNTQVIFHIGDLSPDTTSVGWIAAITGGNPPTDAWRTNGGPNNSSLIDCTNGAQGFKRNGNLSIQNSSTLFFVARTGDQVNYGGIFGSVGWDSYFTPGAGYNHAFWTGGGSPSITSYAGFRNMTTYMLFVDCQNGASSYMHTNGVNSGPNGTVNSSSGQVQPNYLIDGSGYQSFKGSVVEMIYYSPALATNDMRQVEEYFRTKYSLW